MRLQNFLSPELLYKFANSGNIKLLRIQLNFTCNFRCRHCYLDSTHKDSTEIDIDFLSFFLSEMKNRGAKFVRLSGGEPLCCSQFTAIYEMAWDMGYFVEIATNASLFGKEIFRLFERKPPYFISASLYGFSEKTYLDFCKNDAFEKVKHNLLELKRRRIDFEVKTIVTKYNYRELLKIRRFLDENDLKGLFYRNIFCDIDCNRNNYELDLDAEEEIVSYILCRDIETRRKSDKNAYLNCLAGITNFYLNTYKNLYLCPGFYRKTVAINQNLDLALTKIREIRDRTILISEPCIFCEYGNWCTTCIAQLNFLKKENRLENYCARNRSVKNHFFGKDVNYENRFFATDFYEETTVGNFVTLLPRENERSVLVLNETATKIYRALRFHGNLMDCVFTLISECFKEEFDTKKVLEIEKDVVDTVSYFVKQKVFDKSDMSM